MAKKKTKKKKKPLYDKDANPTAIAKKTANSGTRAFPQLKATGRD